MIRFTPKELDAILADFLGKPYQRMATGPDAYDCYGLVKAFMARIGVDIPEIGKVDPKDSRPVYEQQQTDYIRLDWPRPWSLVTFSGKDLNAHIGVVLPNDNLFLHCPGRAAGKVIAEPLSRRPWRDTIDGYWWPRSYLETIIMLTPMTTKRAWQFVRCDGRSLRQIIEQDITEGRDVQVQAFLEGEAVDPADWDLVPGPVNQLVIRPIMGEGEQALMIGGMLAMAALAPWAAGALNEGLALSLGKIGLGVLQAGVMMGGALALNALVGPGEGSKNASQHYTWEPQTTQRVGSFIPLVYGTYGVRGNVICSYATSEATTGINAFTKETQIEGATDLYWLKIAYSDGPIYGIVTGTERLNGKDPEQYGDSDDFTLEHFTGTDDQAASSVPDAFEIPVNQLCDDPTGGANEVTTTFTAVKCDRAAVVLRFPNGFTNYSADGDHNVTTVDITVRIRESDGTWHTLSDEYIWGNTTKPVRLHRWFNETYEGGSAFTIVAGTTYEVGVTRNNSRHSDKGDDFYFDCIQCAFSTAQKHPGLAYTAIGAAASKDISGAIDYYAQIKGKLVRVYDDATSTWSIEWSDNPAWVAYDILTRPVIKGNGTTVPYAVESYRRLDPSYLALDDFVALADWCDEMVSDEAGGTEKRFVFNGVFDEEGSTWEQAIRVLRSACAMPYFRGNKIGVVIDKPGTPVQMFNVSNLREGFSETWIDTSEAATVYDAEFYDETGDYGAESWPVPLLGAANDIPASLDCFGHTKRSRVWRYASRQLRVNQYMKRMVEIPACLDAIYTNLGDIVYVQHPSLQRATGGRIVAVYADGVKVDKPVPVIPAAVAHWKLNETSGTAVADASGNGHTGTASRDTSAMTTTGKINGALNFNATDDYVNIPDHADLRLTGGGAIMAWIKPNSLGETAGRIVDKSTSTTAANGYLFTIGTSGRLTFQVSGGISISVAEDMTYGEWVHVAVTFDGVRAKFYVNGALVSDQAYTTLPPNVVGDVRIGQRAGATDRTFDGAIDDVRIYDTALTPAQIALVYNGGDGTEGLPNYALLVRTHDGTAERLTLYEVASVSGDDDDIVTISGTWEYTPDVNDLFTFGEEVKVIDLYRVKGFERAGNGQVLIQAAQYTTDYYTDDEEAPRIEAKTYSQTKGGIAPSLLPTTAQAVAAERLEAVSAVDTVLWEGLAFTGNGVDKVTWQCTGAGIKYQGTWCPIYADAVGTTDKYVYFDPAIGDPRYLQHTNNLADLAGYERYVFCINDGGVAYFQPGKLMSSQDVKLDAIDHVVQFFYEVSEPTSGMNEGDYWQRRSDHHWFRYDGSAWQSVQDADVVAALNAATTAEAIADGRIVTHRGSAPPLVGHWKLNDNAASTTVVDATGNGHDGVASANTDTLTTTGKINAGFNFGGSDYVLVADHADFSAMTAGSWCAWFKTTHTNQHMLLTKFGSGYEWYLYQLATGAIGLRVFSSSTTAIYLDIQTTAAFNDGSWHHVVAVWDGSLTPAGLFLYIDGEEVAVTRSSAGTFVSVPDTGEDVWIGALGNNTQNWNGQLDDVRIYSRALTYGEALKLYNGGDGTEEVKVPDRGDLWIKSSEDNKPYYWSGSAWTDSGYDVATWSKVTGEGRPEDGADVTANHQADVNIDNITDGTSYKKLTAANLAALQSAINVDTPQPRSGWEGAFTSNSPSAGYVAWSSFVIRYQGTDYTVAASNTASKYLYWNAGGTKTQLYASNAIGDALGVGKFIVGYNEGGTFYPAQFIKIIHGALIQAATILAEHLSVSQLSAIVADLGTVTAGTIILSLGGDNRLKISTSGIQGSDDGGSTWYNIITTDGGKVVIEGDVVKAGTIIADAIADDELTVFRSVNTATAVAFSNTAYATIQSRSFPASGGVVHLTIQVQLKTDSGSGDVVNWQILRGTTEIVSGTQSITNAWKTYAFSCIDLPSSGSYTYYFKVKGVVAAGDAQNRIMYCEEAIK